MKHIHFIGICGVAMSALAIAFKKADFEVSGSDVGFFPPVSTNLEKHQIKFYPGWHPEKMTHSTSSGQAGMPDLVVVGNVASSTNPEWLYVQEHKLNYKSYPEAIEEFFIKANSIVCAGTYGKTTTSALLAWILSECGYNPSYMFGGIAVDAEFNSAQLSNVILSEAKNPLLIHEGDPSTPLRSAQDDNWSVLEGDEYKSARWDNGAKFFHYHPTHLLLTAVEWDHADVYPTEQSYFEAFERLTKSIPETGLLVVSENVPNNIAILLNCSIVTYGQKKSAIYQYNNITMNKDGIEFNILHNSKTYNLKANTFGTYNAENITGAFAMANEIGIPPEKIISAIASFQGLKRRLEKRYEGKITVFDDIAHSPTKAKSVLYTLAEVYKRHPERTLSEPKRAEVEAEGSPSSRIICVFEPNTGNRQEQSAPSYNNAFKDADEVIIPKLTKLKTSIQLKHWEGQELAEIIKKTHSNVKYIEDDMELINYLIKNTQTGDVVVFCGSHGFRGMIDQLISKLSNKQSNQNT